MERLKDKLVSIRRTIHQYPELGNEEFRTSAFIEKILRETGIASRRITKTGVVGILHGKGKGKCRNAIAVRADIDALPVREKTGKPYASKRPGIMHACGHDANTTIVLGAALLLSRRTVDFPGTIKFIFQPNEESSGGAQAMMKAGVLNDPKVNVVLGIHVNPWLPAGTLGLKSNEMMAAVDRFTITIIGDGGHGAYPHLGKDAIVVAGHVIQALQSLVSRELDPVEPAVITIGTIKGGERFNILCDRVEMVGTVRTLNETLHRSMKERIEEKLKGITGAFGTRYSFQYENLGHTLKNSGEILDLCRSSGEAVLGARNVLLLDKPSMGGEDFSEYLRFVPGCFMYLGASPKKSYPWHHEKFDIDENVLPRGAELLAEIAQRYLNSRA